MLSPISRTTRFELNKEHNELLLSRKGNVLRTAVNPDVIERCISCEQEPAMPSTNFQLCFFCVQRHCKYPSCIEESPRRCETCRQKVCRRHSEVHESVIGGLSVYFAKCITCSEESPPLFCCQPLTMDDILPRPSEQVCKKIKSNEKIDQETFDFIKNKI